MTEEQSRGGVHLRPPEETYVGFVYGPSRPIYIIFNQFLFLWVFYAARNVFHLAGHRSNRSRPSRRPRATRCAKRSTNRTAESRAVRLAGGSRSDFLRLSESSSCFSGPRETGRRWNRGRGGGREGGKARRSPEGRGGGEASSTGGSVSALLSLPILLCPGLPPAADLIVCIGRMA